MKKIFFVSFLFQFIILFSQKNTRIYYEKNRDTITYYADNQELFPVSFVFSAQPELENMNKPEAFKMTQVLPSKSLKNKIAYFVVNDKTKRWAVKKMPGYLIYIGDITLKTYDSGYVYDLPFPKGKSFNVYQGYNGKFSHQNENSIDFSMPEGTEILAAREGLVVDLVKHNNSGCAEINCANQANYITILHPDGTFAQYYHLKQNGVLVNIGDQVKKGDIIGLSGNTGWSNGPHLHFVTYLSDSKGDKLRTTLKTLFRTGNGSKTEFVSEKKTYSKNY
ncbi:M23 family metallopeptidase [Chryseobacterium populi]|nr:M23 family metallopeptidase [Chryseobacterium populi]